MNNPTIRREAALERTIESFKKHVAKGDLKLSEHTYNVMVGTAAHLGKADVIKRENDKTITAYFKLKGNAKKETPEEIPAA